MTVLPAESAPLLPRRRELLIATAFVVASIGMLMLTLLGLYLEARSGQRAAWLVDNVIPLAQPNVILFSLLMSSVTVQWAVYSIARDDRGHLYFAIGMTIMFGIAAIVQTWFLYSQIGLAIRQAEGGYFYALTGTHLAMMVGGLLFLAVVGLRALGGSFSARRPEGISAAALFWHATVAFYAVVWLAVYVMK
ncbi:MAG TPA: cytochrome c oxidase subunit 3 [Microthrixaceae bacterium]|nr:cytochrome c oxidase subunit 3 [Microthrixaceae bacterium]